eukprot:835213-Ditylum_brightwellii.AAC.1
MQQSQKKLPKNFQDYLDSLPVWGKYLVYDNKELFTCTTNLATNIKLGQQLWLATDGVTKMHMAYLDGSLQTTHSNYGREKAMCVANLE